MSINIIEMKNGFKCNINDKEKYYKIGESLVELTNFDFKELYDLLHNFQEKENLTYEDYFNKFFQLYNSENNKTSIHFELLKNTLRNFYDNYDDAEFESDCKPFPYCAIPDQKKFNEEIRIFFSSIFSMQYKIRKILNCLSLYKNEDRMVALSNLAKDNMKKNEIQSLGDINVFDFTPRRTNPIYNEFDDMFYYSPLFINNEIHFTLHFSEVETFCFYELRRLLNSDIKIACCPICNTFFASKDKRKKYCSNKCKGISFRKNSEPSVFYELYRKRYQNLSSYYTVHSLDGTMPQKVKTELIALRDRYINKDENDEKIIEKYKMKLKKIK